MGDNYEDFQFLRDLMEELVIYIREAVDRKQENMRRRRRRDALRLQLVRVFELVAEYGTFGIRYRLRTLFNCRPPIYCMILSCLTCLKYDLSFMMTLLYQIFTESVAPINGEVFSSV